ESSPLVLNRAPYSGTPSKSVRVPGADLGRWRTRRGWVEGCPRRLCPRRRDHLDDRDIVRRCAATATNNVAIIEMITTPRTKPPRAPLNPTPPRSPASQISARDSYGLARSTGVRRAIQDQGGRF